MYHAGKNTQWARSKKGNLWRNHNGQTVTILMSKYGTWGYLMIGSGGAVTDKQWAFHSEASAQKAFDAKHQGQ